MLVSVSHTTVVDVNGKWRVDWFAYLCFRRLAYKPTNLVRWAHILISISLHRAQEADAISRWSPTELKKIKWWQGMAISNKTIQHLLLWSSKIYEGAWNRQKYRVKFDMNKAESILLLWMETGLMAVKAVAITSGKAGKARDWKSKFRRFLQN